MTDQHSRHVAGCYGDSIVKTPNIDALADSGVLFSNAYTPFPLCAPARMAFLSGRYSFRTGMYQNSSVLDSSVPTFIHGLNECGYETSLCGRMHFNGPDQRHGFAHRVFGEVSRHAVGSLIDTNGFKRTAIEKSGAGRNHYLLYDTECAEAGVSWLDARDSDIPFCLVIGLTGPHCPFVCPRELYDWYFERIEIPEVSDEEIAGISSYTRRFRSRSGLDNVSDDDVRRTRAAYYGMVEYDDTLVGKIVDAALENDPNTTIVYCSDHGEMAGEHGLWWKMSFYEGSVGIPLIISGAREAYPHVVDEPVSLIDLGETLLELAGAPKSYSIDGTSLVPLLDDETNADVLSRPVFSELYTNPAVWTEHGPSGGPAAMIRRGSWKYIKYRGEPDELYDLANDPGEKSNLGGDSATASRRLDLDRHFPEGWNIDSVETASRSQFAAGLPVDSTPPSELWLGPEGYGVVE